MEGPCHFKDHCSWQFTVATVKGKVAVVMARIAALSLNSKRANLNTNFKACLKGEIFEISISFYNNILLIKAMKELSFLTFILNQPTLFPCTTFLDQNYLSAEHSDNWSLFSS